MATRGSARREKPLTAIDNILNLAHVPVYRRLRQSSLKKKSMAAETKLHLYDFETENNENDGKKYKKSQKVRKRARIGIRHNKENALKNDNGLKDIFRDLPQNAGLNNKILKEKPLNCDSKPKKGILKVQADVHHHFSPVDNDIISVGSENCDDSFSEDDDQPFHGFNEEQCKDKYSAFVKACENLPANAGALNLPLIDTPAVPSFNSYMTPHPYLTPNPYMTPDPYKTPRKVLSPRYSNIPIIEFNQSAGGNQLQPNRSSENINPNDTFHNASYGANVRYYSTPFKNNSFNSSSLSNLSVNDFNVTNCFGFEEPDNFNEEFLISPIKLDVRQPLASVKPLNLDAPSRPQLPLVEDVISQLRHETEDLHIKSDKLFIPEIEESVINEKDSSHFMNSSSVPHDLSGNQEDDSQLPGLKSPPSHSYDHKIKPGRRSYERPAYLRQRKNSHHEESDMEEWLDEVKPKKAQKACRKKPGPTKKEADELEKWAKAFNSQCAQVDAFDLCIE